MHKKEVKQTKQHTAMIGGLSRLRAALVLCTVAVVTLAPAQNLVPNGSFEEYTDCPNNGGQLIRALGWEQNAYTPEYFNRCSNDPWASVPNNRAGFQEPHHGNAYVGLITYTEPDWVSGAEMHREIAGVALTEALAVGVPIHVSLWVAPAGYGNLSVRIKWTCRGIGVKFRMGPMDMNNPSPPSNDPDVFLPAVLLDTAGWTHVSGSFVPDSAYTYLTLGNMLIDGDAQPTLIDVNGNYGVAYAFVDDVCVSHLSADCINTALEELEPPCCLSAWPNPFFNSLMAELPHAAKANSVLELRNLQGQIVLQRSLSPGDRRVSIATNLLEEGYYVLCYRSEREAFSPIRLLNLNH